MNAQKRPILAVENLVVAFDTDSGLVRAVDNVSFELQPGRVLGLAGESGCGKSVTALAVMRLLPQPVSKIMKGCIKFQGTDILALPVQEMHHIRGKRISMIFQEPMTALNPVHTVGQQIMEVFARHFPGMPGKETVQRSVSMLADVGIPDPDRVMGKYPHQLSGGMRQRVMIAMALACEPEILIADEPTTALDVTVQAQILDLILELKEKSGMSVILITHDLGVIAQHCDDVVVMYAGRVAETARVADLFGSPVHPYTQGLLASIPSMARSAKTRLPTIQGHVPSLWQMPLGCRFAQRCPRAGKICTSQIPVLRSCGENRTAACHFAVESKKNSTK